MDLSSKKIGSSVNQHNPSSQGKASVGRMANYGTPPSLKSLTEGQVIKGEVVDLRNNEVSLLLEDNTMVTGRLDNVNFLSIGDVGAFKVSQIQPGKISLQAIPLSQNTVEANTMFKALEEAGLPHNSRNQEVVLSLIRNQMPITKSSILNILKQCYDMKDVSANSIVLLNKFNIPATLENATQLDHYQNDSYKLSNQMNSCLNDLPGFLKEMAYYSDDELAGNTKELLSIVGCDESNLSSNTPSTSYIFSSDEAKEEFIAILEDFDLSENTKNAILNDTLSLTVLKEVLNSTYEKAQTIDIRNENEALAGLSNVDRINPLKIKEALADVPRIVDVFDHEEINRLNQAYDDFVQNNHLLGSVINEEGRMNLGKFLINNPNLNNFVQNILNGSATIGDTLNALAAAVSSSDLTTLQGLLNSGEIATLLTESLKQQWSLTDKDLKKENGIKALYAKVLNQSNKLNSFIQNMLPEVSESNFSHDIMAMKNNIDFMQMLNNIFPYIQIPFQANGFPGHGDLYVYTQKKDLQRDPKHLTVLLHLSLEHLGDLDVHMTVNETSLENKFYVENAQSKRFIKKNISLLEDKIRALGYTVHTEFTDKEQKVDIVKDFISRKVPQEEIKRYSFDIRA